MDSPIARLAHPLARRSTSRAGCYQAHLSPWCWRSAGGAPSARARANTLEHALLSPSSSQPLVQRHALLACSCATTGSGTRIEVRSGGFCRRSSLHWGVAQAASCSTTSPPPTDLNTARIWGSLRSSNHTTHNTRTHKKTRTNSPAHSLTFHNRFYAAWRCRGCEAGSANGQPR